MNRNEYLKTLTELSEFFIAEGIGKKATRNLKYSLSGTNLDERLKIITEEVENLFNNDRITKVVVEGLSEEQKDRAKRLAIVFVEMEYDRQ